MRPPRKPPFDPSDYTMEGYARRAYVEGRIEVDELERALEHIGRGGTGNAEFPYLPAYRALDTDPAEY